MARLVCIPVRVEGVEGEGEGGEEGLEAWDEELLGDARYGAKVLALRDFVDMTIIPPYSRVQRLWGEVRR